jgi:hypothetical protein
LNIATGATTDGNGGSINITAASGATTTATARDGGSITLTVGAAVSGGTTGAVNICTAITQRLGFFGVTAVAQQATPVTLADVIALLQAYGLSA